MAYPVWPASLTDASWQKKKGSIAKVAGKTGVGEAMKAAKALFDKLDFNSVEASQLPKNEISAEFLTEKKAAVLDCYKTSVDPVRSKIKEIEEAANKTAVNWKKNKLIPKDSVKAAEDVAAAAVFFSTSLKTNSPFMSEIAASYDKRIDIANRSEDLERGKIATSISELKKSLGVVVKDLTRKGWEEGPHQRCRSVCNALKAIPGLKKQFFKEWEPYGNAAKDVIAGSETERNDVIQIVKDVGTSLKKLESTYLAHM